MVATETWSALGTTAVLCAPPRRLTAARDAVRRELERIDAQASRFRPDSELSRVNRAGGARVRITTGLLDALRVAVHAAAISGGAVDPTLGGSLVGLGYDRDWSELDHVPADAPLATPRPTDRRRSAWREIELGDQPPSVRVAAGVSLDLGATAKGLAADRGARAAGAAAGPDAGVLLSLGGDLATAGPAPDGGWLVRIAEDHRRGDGPGETIALHEGGLATSSLTVRRWYRDGRALHHVLDPETGAPVTPVWRTVSVVAASCAEAEIATTAALVLGARAPAWIAGHGLPARLVALDGTVHAQGGWPR
jgi:thiamine biosynthesis lipoprotein